MCSSPAPLESLCGALSYAMGIEPPAHAAPANETLVAFIRQAFGNEKADRMVMYNPDAIGQWISDKYPELLKAVTDLSQLALPLCAPMPTVTPVCFGTMYTGAEPAVHGIQSYVKPVITIDTLFDALIRAGKRPVILAYGRSSLGKIFLERDMDYFILENIEQVNAKACSLILEDRYDVYIIYNGNYDTNVHKYGPEDPKTLAELRLNAHVFGMLYQLIQEHWKQHRTLLAFAMDHGCHLKEPGVGTHGSDMPEDRNIVHHYVAFNKEREV